jgi:hypothetical protein
MSAQHQIARQVRSMIASPTGRRPRTVFGWIGSTKARNSTIEPPGSSHQGITSDATSAHTSQTQHEPQRLLEHRHPPLTTR